MLIRPIYKDEDKYMKIIFFLSVLLIPTLCNAQMGRRIGSVSYSHATVGTSAQDAVAPASVDSRIVGWKVCHDSESAATYLSLSTGVDPDVDGARIGPGNCFLCLECGGQTLKDLNVKGQAAGTGYSVIQFK
jgi:hypothetical protein